MSELDDEIDFRQYLHTLLGSWRFILLLGGVAAVVAALVGWMRPPVYRATTLVSVAQLSYSLRLDGVIQEDPLPERSYIDLATSDAVVAEVMSRVSGLLGDQLPEVDAFRGRLEAQPGSAPSLLRLRVTNPDSELAATIANTWAEALVERAAELYGPGTGQLESYSAQLTTAAARLEAAEDALTVFQANNQLLFWRSQLESYRLSLNDFLNRQHRYELLRRDAQELLARLEQSDPQSPAASADETALLLLVAQGLNASPVGAGGASAMPPLQLQVSGASASSQTAGQLAVTVRSYLATLEAQATDAQAQAEALSPAILALQSQIASADAVLRELTRARDQAEAQYIVLARKVDEVKIVDQDAGASLKIASRAAVPEDVSGAGAILLGLAGGVAGVLVGSFVALLRDWLRGGVRPAERPRREPPPEPVAAVQPRPGLD